AGELCVRREKRDGFPAVLEQPGDDRTLIIASHHALAATRADRGLGEAYAGQTPDPLRRRSRRRTETVESSRAGCRDESARRSRDKYRASRTPHRALRQNNCRAPVESDRTNRGPPE